MRDPLARFSAPMQRFLKDNPVTLSTPPGPSVSGVSRKPRKQRNGVNTYTASDTQGGTQETNFPVGIIFLLQ